jgi:hypothetical protein
MFAKRKKKKLMLLSMLTKHQEANLEELICRCLLGSTQPAY